MRWSSAEVTVVTKYREMLRPINIIPDGKIVALTFSTQWCRGAWRLVSVFTLSVSWVLVVASMSAG